MAAVDYFLKIDGIEGESADSKHKGEIQLESWSWGEHQSGTHSAGSGGGAGKVSMQDFHFVMKINKASPKLMLACATGEHIKKALLTCRKAGKEQQEFLKVELEGLLVSSYQTGGSGHSDIVPTDQIALNFTKILFEYKEQKADGTLGAPTKAGYDLKVNKTV
jgi:type VI secretion system secreted protein Hcp